MVMSPPVCLSRVTVTVPLPLWVAEMNIQPSLDRLNVNGWLDFEIEETSSSSETRLFNLFSPEKRTSASAPAANRQIRTAIEGISLTLITWVLWCGVDDG